MTSGIESTRGDVILGDEGLSGGFGGEGLQEAVEGAEGGKVGGSALALEEKDAVGEGEGGGEGATGGAAADHDVVVVGL